MGEPTGQGIDGERAMAVVYWTVGVAGLFVCAFAALGAFWHPHRGGGAEGTMNIRKLHDASVAYFRNHQSFPASTPLHPELGCRRRESTWEEPTWEALQFRIVDPHRFSFQYDSSGSGASAQFTASAFGDLDCDGVASTFVRFGSVREIEVDGGSPRLEVRGSIGLYIANESE